MGGVFLRPSSGPPSDLLFGDTGWTVECHRLGNSVDVGAVLVLGWMRTDGSPQCFDSRGQVILRVRCWSNEAASPGLLSFGASALKAILAQVEIQAPGLSSRCISHLGNFMKTRMGQFFTVYTRVVPVLCRPVITCGKCGCAGSCLVAVVENGYKSGRRPASRDTCGRTYPRPNVSVADNMPARVDKKRKHSGQKESTLQLLGSTG